MGKRRQGREVALKLLYALEVTQAEVQETLTSEWAARMISQDNADFIAALVTGVRAHRDEIDAVIQAWSEHWSLARIGLVERNILRLAIYELLFLPEVPANVAINEAVEVTKRYGAQDAWLFINGILDRVKHEAVPQRAAGMLQGS